jgi:hypothetical protein
VGSLHIGDPVGRKSRKKQPEFDELYVLRLDSSGRPRGARYAKLKDDVASAAVDMKCRALIIQPKAVSALAMSLPVGRLYRGRPVLPRIRRDLYDRILEAARIAAEREKARMKTGAAKQLEFVKQLIQQTETALAEARKINRRRSRPS